MDRIETNPARENVVWTGIFSNLVAKASERLKTGLLSTCKSDQLSLICANFAICGEAVVRPVDKSRGLRRKNASPPSGIGRRGLGELSVKVFSSGSPPG